jgi:hypothetical protein
VLVLGQTSRIPRLVEEPLGLGGLGEELGLLLERLGQRVDLALLVALLQHQLELVGVEVGQQAVGARVLQRTVQGEELRSGERRHPIANQRQLLVEAELTLLELGLGPLEQLPALVDLGLGKPQVDRLLQLGLGALHVLVRPRQLGLVVTHERVDEAVRVVEPHAGHGPAPLRENEEDWDGQQDASRRRSRPAEKP